MNNELPKDYFSLQIETNRRNNVANVSILYISYEGISFLVNALEELFETEMMSSTNTKIADGFHLLEFRTRAIEKLYTFKDALTYKLQMHDLISQISLN
jgi:hypothetical protein